MEGGGGVGRWNGMHAVLREAEEALASNFKGNSHHDTIILDNLGQYHGWYWCAGPLLKIKMSYYQYRKSHCEDNTIIRSSYLRNGISYTGMTASLYWISPLVPCITRTSAAVTLTRQNKQALDLLKNDLNHLHHPSVKNDRNCKDYFMIPRINSADGSPGDGRFRIVTILSFTVPLVVDGG